MLADAQDGSLSSEDQARFDAHMATCTACSEMLADAQRGAAWLEMLRTPRPEPPAALLERILAQTGGQAGNQAGPRFVPQAVAMDNADDPQPMELAPAAAGAKVLPFHSRMASMRQGGWRVGRAILQPRLAMTAAMAFFSIGLTLNLTGVQLNQLRATDLKPANIRRSFYEADAHIVRYYENLRVVYELESRVKDLQRTSDSDTPTPSEKKPAIDADPDLKAKPKPRPGSGTSRRQGLGDLDGAPLRLASAPAAVSSSTLQEGELV